MKLVRITLFFLFISVALFAAENDTKNTIRIVNSLIKKEQLDEAKKMLLGAIQKDPNNILLLEKMGRLCFTMDNGEREAIQYLTKVVKYYKTNAVVSKFSLEANYFLSQAYHLNGQYDEALETLLVAKNQVPAEETELLAKMNREVSELNMAIKLKMNPLQFKTNNLGPKLNTSYEEHSPVISSDETRLLFTSTRPINKTKKNELPIEGIWESIWNGKSWSDPQPLPADINSNGSNASSSISFDGSTLFFYKNDNGEGDIYTAQLNDKGVWVNPTKMPRPINSFADETSASLSADGSVLFFTSNRSGGYGGLDIYSVRRLPNGEWSKEQNLGPTINTSEDEEAPFLHADGQTFFFSSRGHETSGAFDIFKSTMDENGQFSQPTNIGYPMNTPDDDIFFQPTVDGQRVYFVSHKNTGEGGSDLYLLEFLDTDKRSMAVVTCSANPLGNDSIVNATLTVKEIESQSIMGNYRCNPYNGKFVVILPVGKSYRFDFDNPGCNTITKEITIEKRKEYVSTRKTISIEVVDFTLKEKQ